MNTVTGMVKINLKQSKIAYLIFGIILAAGTANYIISILIYQKGNATVAIGNYAYLLPLLTAIFIPALHFSKLMGLGGKRMDFFKSGILSYISLAAAASFISIVSYFTIDKYMVTKVGILDLLNVFGFMTRGAAVAFLQMTAFLILFCCVLHTLTLAQGRWYGWAADVLIVAVISVFTPIASLRAVLVWFFNMIIFHETAVVQIASCLVLGAAVYCFSLVPIRNKPI